MSPSIGHMRQTQHSQNIDRLNTLSMHNALIISNNSSMLVNTSLSVGVYPVCMCYARWEWTRWIQTGGDYTHVNLWMDSFHMKIKIVSWSGMIQKKKTDASRVQHFFSSTQRHIAYFSLTVRSHTAHQCNNHSEWQFYVYMHLLIKTVYLSVSCNATGNSSQTVCQYHTWPGVHSVYVSEVQIR